MIEQQSIRVFASTNNNAFQRLGSPLILDRPVCSTVLNIGGTEHGIKKAVIHFLFMNEFKRSSDRG